MWDHVGNVYLWKGKVGFDWIIYVVLSYHNWDFQVLVLDSNVPVIYEPGKVTWWTEQTINGSVPLV